ncbi:hypothetical protein [Dorea sp. ICN-14282]|uniref:hypothetical protein n=1 Tax=Dorea sp. ICN-14282 TaxID=3134654 RepID=UPI0030BD1A64
MKRWIRYLYEYDQGKKLRNVGFVKVEQGEGECSVHIHGKGLHMQGENRLNLYLFYEENEECIGIWQGTAENVDPAINYRLYYTKEDTGKTENFEKIRGIVLLSEAGRRYAAVWDDQPAHVETMRICQEEPQQTEAVVQEEEPEQAEPARQETEPEPEESARQEMEPEQEEIGEREIEPEQEDVVEREIEPEQEENLSRIHCVKIQRRDLARLSRCEWKLANNSFLLHGCYNYRHLAFLEYKDQLWLGVPGVYHPQEARAAEAMGFPEFIYRKDTDASSEEEEEFGYWCRRVKRRPDTLMEQSMGNKRDGE